MEIENRIISDARVLTEQFIPREITSRDGQLKVIRDSLRPLIKGLPARHSFLYGPPGTGKTCIARFVAEELASYTSSVLQSYVNCWECTSRFRVLYAVLQSLGMQLAVHRKGTPTDELLDVLRGKLKEQSCVIILDEVDQLEDDKIFYDLLALPNACLIIISNSETALYTTDSRIRSRLAAAERLEFPLYRVREIVEMLKRRAEWGLIPGVIKNTQLEKLADMSGGDARAAIGMLRVVAEAAENDDAESVADTYLEKAKAFTASGTRERALEKMNPYQRLILDILSSRKTLDSGNLYREFTSLVSKRGLEPIVDRTFRRYMDKMVRCGLIIPSGDGRWRTYSSVAEQAH
ncbi:MAG: Cdc6/Cdc18 family protein [Candidatus Aenigmatarchaeota archaeon]